ncbi:hypothetical protein AR457_10335 [Streptomyces agglomeratus]|uniref:hypothetical protein n=1 Tax=Streptomyces agglomeratus TaxID=285458 RepID=UPI000854539D|nr:hypothetical protein [Streptomyces agglomeratus]OEJ41178.1 hypothetical protein BGK70_26320 [Streptomyces agglomeratus]OEJ44445.1 hypothetical protein AR457_10335 [Streptomyces agglomeratus]
MFKPKYPAPDAYTAPRAPAAPASAPVQYTVPAPAPVPTRHAPAVQLTPGALVALVGGGLTAVLVVGAVLVSMLLAVAVTGVSVAVCAVVLRSLLNSNLHR